MIDRFKGAMTACRVTPPGWLTDFKRNPVMAVIAVVKQRSVPDMQHALRYVPHRIARGETAQKFLNPVMEIGKSPARTASFEIITLLMWRG
ncbi:hypothetical protein [Niveispirillum lacus]|uniref:hypothetical protein n=1 Tax=Niveispirillum lacus TaxID=1981099 RepID=UPI0013FD9A2D|nr:hypothetical protein [Niveispirillum lacus]